MRWLSFLRGGNETFGYVVADADGSEGVVDAGARSEFVSLREAIGQMRWRICRTAAATKPMCLWRILIICPP